MSQLIIGNVLYCIAIINLSQDGLQMFISVSVTRLGNFLDFGQLFKAFGNYKFTQISHILRQFFCKGVKMLNFSSEIIFGNFY